VLYIQTDKAYNENKEIRIKGRHMVLRFCGYGIPTGFYGYEMGMPIEIQSHGSPDLRR